MVFFILCLNANSYTFIRLKPFIDENFRQQFYWVFNKASREFVISNQDVGLRIGRSQRLTQKDHLSACEIVSELLSAILKFY